MVQKQKPLVSKIVNDIVVQEMSSFVRIVGSLCRLNTFTRRAGIDVEDLCQMSILRLLETLSDEKLSQIPETQRTAYVRRCLIRTAQQRYATVCRIEKRRGQLEEGMEIMEYMPDFWETFEQLEAFSRLSGRERALIRNSELKYTELHNRLYDGLSYERFRKALIQELDTATTKLEREIDGFSRKSNV